MTCGWNGREWRGWRVLVFLGTLGGLQLQPAQANVPSYLRFLEEGLERMAGGEGAAARSLFEAASMTDPQDPLGSLALGCEALRRGEVVAAASFFRRAARAENPPPEAAYGLGLCYLLTGRAEPAGKWLRKAWEQDPSVGSVSVYLSLLALLAGQYPQAQQHLQQARAQDADPEWLDFLQLLLDWAQGAWPQVAQSLQDRLASSEPAAARRPPEGPCLPLRIAFTGASKLHLELIPSALSLEDPEPAKVFPPQIPPPEDRPHFQNLAPGRIVRGVQTLRVRLPAGLQPDFVTLSVDGRCVSVTNNRPYVFRWDTTREREGLHQLTIRAEGAFVAEHCLDVIVQNQEPEPEVRYDPAVRQELAGRLGQLLKIFPPRWDLEALLLQVYLRSGRFQEALRLAEARLARDWQPQALPLLLDLYARTGRSQPPEDVGELHRAAVRQVRVGLPGGQRVALTFDDGPNIPHTQEILQLLEAYQARATFLVVGWRAEQYPHLLRQIAAQGHEIGNHSYWHRRMLNLGESEILLEVLRTEWVVRQAGVVPARLFRPPGGHVSPQVRAALGRLGYTLLLWTVNGGAFKNFPAAEAARRMVEGTRDGTIFLLHNGPDNTLQLLPHLLRGLRARGFRCVTVSEILQPPIPSGTPPAEGGT